MVGPAGGSGSQAALLHGRRDWGCPCVQFSPSPVGTAGAPGAAGPEGRREGAAWARHPRGRMGYEGTAGMSFAMLGSAAWLRRVGRQLHGLGVSRGWLQHGAGRPPAGWRGCEHPRSPLLPLPGAGSAECGRARRSPVSLAALLGAALRSWGSGLGAAPLSLPVSHPARSPCPVPFSCSFLWGWALSGSIPRLPQTPIPKCGHPLVPSLPGEGTPCSAPVSLSEET